MNYSFEESCEGVEPCLIGSTHSKNPTCRCIHSYLDTEGVRYSCDNLRYRIHFNPHAYDAVCMMLDTYMTMGRVVTYHGANRPGGYREMWQYVHESQANDAKEHEETSFAIGLGHVEGSGRCNAGIGYLEFNPAKINEEGSRMVDFLLGHDIALELVRYDLAIDYPVQRDLVRFRKDGRRYECVISDSMTEYLGQRNKPGRCKLYDKAAERGYMGELTRIELTCDAVWTPSQVLSMLPTVYDYRTDLKGRLKGVTLAYVVALQEIAANGDTLEPWLRMCDPRTRAKIRNALSDKSALNYDTGCISNLISSVNSYID